MLPRTSEIGSCHRVELELDLVFGQPLQKFGYHCCKRIQARGSSPGNESCHFQEKGACIKVCQEVQVDTSFEALAVYPPSLFIAVSNFDDVGLETIPMEYNGGFSSHQGSHQGCGILPPFGPHGAGEIL